MKKIYVAPLVAGLLLLAACAGPTPAPDPTPAPSPAFSFTNQILEPPLMEDAAHLYTPDFLSAEQESLYRRAMSLGGMLFSGTGAIDAFPMPDGTKPKPTNPDMTSEIQGDYLVSYGRFAQWDDFEAMMRSVFTPEYYELLLADAGGPDRFVRLEDGRTGYMDLSRGSDASYAGWWNDEYELVTSTDDVLECNLIAHYGVWGGGEMTPEEHRTETYPIRMERTEDGWRVAEFHIPY